MELSVVSLEQSASDVEDRSGTITIVTWVLLAVTVTCFIARQVMKAVVFRTIAFDDVFITLASICAIGSFVTTMILASRGLGILGILTIERAHTLMKGYYASQFLYITSICFSKLSIMVLLYTIVAIQRAQRRLVLGLGSFVCVWSVGSLFAVAFQCELPRPWEVLTLQCFNTRIFWTIYCVIDLSTEICIIMLAIHLVSNIRVRNTRKAAVVACFAPRVLDMAASITRLVWLYPITPHSNPEFRLWLPTIATQVHLCISICTACIPYMVPFFKTLEVNLRRTNLSKSRELRFDEPRRASSALWFRRTTKSDTFRSWDSTAVASLQYERVPDASPHIDTPQPLSPLTPPRYNTPPSTSECDKPSAQNPRGLCITIPTRTSSLSRIEYSTPQTASSFALSPSCVSPMASISMASISAQSFVPTRKAPTPPPKTHSPYQPTVSSCYSNRPASPPSPTQPRFSLFPQRTSHSRRTSDQEYYKKIPPRISPIRSLRAQTTVNNDKNTIYLSPFSTPKIRTAPLLSVRPESTTPPATRYRPASVQELHSPMGAAINDYFKSTTLDLPAPRSDTLEVPANAQRQRNHQILSPSNALRTVIDTPRSPPSALRSSNTHRDELWLPRDSLLMTRSSRSHTMPTVRDVRSSPQLIVHDPQ